MNDVTLDLTLSPSAQTQLSTKLARRFAMTNASIAGEKQMLF